MSLAKWQKQLNEQHSELGNYACCRHRRHHRTATTACRSGGCSRLFCVHVFLYELRIRLVPADGMIGDTGKDCVE